MRWISFSIVLIASMATRASAVDWGTHDVVSLSHHGLVAYKGLSGFAGLYGHTNQCGCNNCSKSRDPRGCCGHFHPFRHCCKSGCTQRTTCGVAKKTCGVAKTCCKQRRCTSRCAKPRPKCGIAKSCCKPKPKCGIAKSYFKSKPKCGVAKSRVASRSRCTKSCCQPKKQRKSCGHLFSRRSCKSCAGGSGIQVGPAVPDLNPASDPPVPLPEEDETAHSSRLPKGLLVLQTLFNH